MGTFYDGYGLEIEHFYLSNVYIIYLYIQTQLHEKKGCCGYLKMKTDCLDCQSTIKKCRNFISHSIKITGFHSKQKIMNHIFVQCSHTVTCKCLKKVSLTIAKVKTIRFDYQVVTVL